MRTTDTGAIAPPPPYGYAFLDTPRPLIEQTWTVLARQDATGYVGILVYNFRQSLWFLDAEEGILLGAILIECMPNLLRSIGSVFALEYGDEIELLRRAWVQSETEQMESLAALLGPVKPSLQEGEAL